ncbi:hypothetical protein [Calidifontibacter terrae]
MIGNRLATAAYWLVGIVLSVLAGVGGAAWGNSLAPSFDNDNTGGTPATSASRLLYSIFGGLLCGFGVLAVFAAIFMVLWVRARRAEVEVDDEETDESLIDDLEFGDDEDSYDSFEGDEDSYDDSYGDPTDGDAEDSTDDAYEDDEPSDARR